MSALNFKCERCESILEVDENLKGQTLNCPRCSCKVKVPRYPTRHKCPRCNSAVLIDEKLRGSEIECPNCQKGFRFGTVPAPPPPIKTPVQSAYQQDAGKGMVQEFRRTCKRCGKVWHTSVERENQIVSSTKSGALLGALNVFNDDAFAQWNRNTQSNISEINRLRSCPECGSASYDQQIV